MQSVINIKAMPESAKSAFLRALAKELYRIRANPALWAQVEERANIRRENNGSVTNGKVRG